MLGSIVLFLLVVELATSSIICNNTAVREAKECIQTKCRQSQRHLKGDSDSECTIGGCYRQHSIKIPIKITLTQLCISGSHSRTVDLASTKAVIPNSSKPLPMATATVTHLTTKTETHLTTKTETPKCSEPTRIILYSSAITTSMVTLSHSQQVSTIVYHTTETVTVSTECSKNPSKALGSTCNHNTSVTPLGVLLGAMIAIVVVIIIGWVYTCWRARNKGKATSLLKTRRPKLLKTTHDDEERLFENPTYDGTTEQQQGRQAQQQQHFPGVTYAIYDTVTTPSKRETQNGETYNVLQRGKENARLPCITEYQQYIHKGAVGRSGARRVVSSNQDMSYSLLGLPDKDVQHNYHVVEQH